MDTQAIALSLQRRVACPPLDPAVNPCTTAGKLVDLMDRDGAVLVSKAGTLYGSFTARAECSPSRDGIILRLARLSNSGNVNSTVDNGFKPDPLTNKIAKWSDPGTLAQATGVYFCPNSEMGGITWVAMEYDAPAVKVGWQLFSFIKGNKSPDEYCISKGFSGAGTASKLDNIEPAGYKGHDWGSGFFGQSSFQATKFPDSPFSNRWAISCPSHYWQKPDFINCVN
jgi:hypothetical protein